MNRTKGMTLVEIRKGALDRYHRVKALVDGGMQVESACKQVNCHTSEYYKTGRGIKAGTYNSTKAEVKAKPRVSQLKITDLPVVNSDNGRAFIVFGSPKMLAEFVRSYE